MSAEEDREINLQRAREVAFECMLEYGVNLTTHEMIAKKLGLGLRTLRRYFRTKVDLVCDVVSTVGSERYNILCSKMIESISPDDTGLEQLKHLHYWMLNLCKEKRSPFLMISELELFGYENYVPDEKLRLYLKTVQDSRKYAKRMLIKGMTDGSIRGDIDPEAYTTLLTNTYVGMLQRMAAVRYTKTDYNLTSIEEQVDLHVEAVMTIMKKSSELVSNIKI